MDAIRSGRSHQSAAPTNVRSQTIGCRFQSARISHLTWQQRRNPQRLCIAQFVRLNRHHPLRVSTRMPMNQRLARLGIPECRSALATGLSQGWNWNLDALLRTRAAGSYHFPAKGGEGLKCGNERHLSHLPSSLGIHSIDAEGPGALQNPRESGFSPHVPPEHCQAIEPSETVDWVTDTTCTPNARMLDESEPGELRA